MGGAIWATVEGPKDQWNLSVGKDAVIRAISSYSVLITSTIVLESKAYEILAALWIDLGNSSRLVNKRMKIDRRHLELKGAARD